MSAIRIGRFDIGKSTVLKLIEAIIPREYIANVSPLDFDKEYQRAALAGKLLNLVPEIDKAKPIPSDYFKSLVSGDTVNAREVYGLVFSFKTEAANWFNGNFEPTTRDHSEGFFRRWAVFEFFHGKSDSERDPLLLNRILKNELAGILNWAFEGVMDYLSNGLYLSNTHYSFISKWKREANSVLSWLSDVDDLYKRDDKSQLPLKATDAYYKYKIWCTQSHRKTYSKKEFYSYMTNAGYTPSNSNGVKVFLDFTATTMFNPIKTLQQVS